MVYKKSEKPRSCDKKKDTDVTQTICQSHETGPQGRVLLTFLIFDKHGKQKIRKATVMRQEKRYRRDTDYMSVTRGRPTGSCLADISDFRPAWYIFGLANLDITQNISLS